MIFVLVPLLRCGNSSHCVSENSEKKTAKWFLRMVLFRKAPAVTTGRSVLTEVSRLETSDSVEAKGKGKPQWMLRLHYDCFAERSLMSISLALLASVFLCYVKYCLKFTLNVHINLIVFHSFEVSRRDDSSQDAELIVCCGTNLMEQRAFLDACSQSAAQGIPHPTWATHTHCNRQ